MSTGRMMATVCVTTVRSRGELGGCIFRGRIVDPSGHAREIKRYLIIKASYDVIADADVGEFWTVTGTPGRYAYTINGYPREEDQLVPDLAEPIRPAGENIVAALADSPVFRGVGAVLARRLWETYGENLHEILDAGDADALRPALAFEAATNLVQQWRAYGQRLTLRWLGQFKLSRRIAQKVLCFYGDGARDMVAEDPYRLLAFEADWATVDTLARARFGVADDDPRRLVGAVEEALYRHVARKHTLAARRQLEARLVDLLAPRGASDRREARALSLRAPAAAVAYGVCYARPDGYHPSGVYLMERDLAERFARMARSPAPPIDQCEVARAAAAFRAAMGYALDDDQMAAVERTVNNRLAIVTGGAGVGKTTVLRVVCDVLAQRDIDVLFLSPTGRGARRMRERTGREVATIASFIGRMGDGSLTDRHCVVIDDASVVDVPTMHAVMRRVPEGGCLILAGDPARVAPIGPGLMFHALAAAERLDGATAPLTTMYRRSSGGDILAAAAAVRAHRWIALPHFEGLADGISILPCMPGDIAGLTALAMDAYEAIGGDAGDVGILCPTVVAGVGTEALNNLAQERYRATDDRICHCARAGQLVATGFRVGDLVVWTRNDYALGVTDGTLGRVVGAGSPPTADVCVIDVEGKRVKLAAGDMDNIALGYAITVHRAQGSHFDRVIVPVSGDHRALDNSLIYTAITRGERQVVLVGDEGAARAAVEGIARVPSRQVGFPTLLHEALGESAAARLGE